MPFHTHCIRGGYIGTSEPVSFELEGLLQLLSVEMTVDNPHVLLNP